MQCLQSSIMCSALSRLKPGIVHAASMKALRFSDKHLHYRH